MVCGFGRYKAYADIRWGSLVRCRQVIENASFLCRPLYLPYKVPHWLYILKVRDIALISLI